MIFFDSMENSKVNSNHLKSVSGLKELGFAGFVSAKTLRTKAHLIPSEPGVYLLLRDSDSPPKFLSVGTGGYFKNKDPNVSVTRLKNEWVPDATIVYVGKAGGIGLDSNLNNRINQLIKFGEGKKVPHWGGRLVWQLCDAEQLLVCWKVARESQPRKIEKMIIEKFKQSHRGMRPFANLQD